MRTHLFHFSKFLSLLSLLESRSERKALFALFPPLDPVDYQCMAGTDERLRCGAKRVLDRRLLGHSSESNLLEHLNHSIVEQFNRYVEKIIIEEGLVASTPINYHIHIEPCLRYLLGLSSEMVADPFYRIPILYIKSDAVFRILDGFESDMNRALSDVTATFDEQMVLLNDKVKRWLQSGLVSDLEAIETCELITLVREVNPRFSITDFAQWDDEHMSMALNYEEFESELLFDLRRYAQPAVARTLVYKDAFTNPDKVASYLLSYEPEKVSQAVDLLFSTAEAFKYSSPLATLAVIDQARKRLAPYTVCRDPFERARIHIKVGNMYHQLEKLQRIMERVDAFITAPQAQSEGGATQGGLTEYFKRINSPNEPHNDIALFEEFVENFAPFALFSIYLHNIAISSQIQIPKLVYRHPESLGLIAFILSHKDPKDVEMFFNSKRPAYAHDLIKAGRLGVLKVYSEFGLNLDGLDSKGRTPVKLAVEKRDFEAFKILLENNATLEYVDRRDISTNIACYAARKNIGEVLTMLLESGRSLVEPDSTGKTPTYHAAEHGHLECLNVLFEKQSPRARVNLGRVDNNNIAPILIAAKNGHRQVVEFFAQYDQMELIDRSGHTPMFWAVQLGFVKAVDLLAECGASLCWINKEDSHEIWHRVFRHPNAVGLIDVLAKQGVDLNKKYKGKFTPFLVALKYEYPEAICVELYKKGAYISSSRFQYNPISKYLNRVERKLIIMIRCHNKRDRNGINKIYQKLSSFEKSMGAALF